MTTTISPTLEQIQQVEQAHVVQTYKRQPVAFVRGEGAYLFDTEGTRYLDFVSGIGVASLGHGHAGLADALASQARELAHTSNLYFHPLQGALAKRLAAHAGLSRAFLCNSGTEAVEGCLKFARRYWHAQGGAGRTEFVAFTRSFAGRTMGSLSVTWDEHYRAPFQPLVPGVTFVEAGDAEAIRRAITPRTAAVIVEPIQGEGGINPLPAAAADAISQACRETGALVIADEVQSGSGRTGDMFASAAYGLQPDLMSVGKAIGGGMPVGAVLLSERVAQAVQFGDHGTTYGGNLLACRAALYVLDQLELGLLAQIRRSGQRLSEGFNRLAARHAAIQEVRGKGVIWGLALDRDASPVVPAALKRGLLVNRTAERVIRVLPPYIVSEHDIDQGIELLDAALADGLGGQA
ncbi:MAG: aspartate aminotransferase family protein [Vicinamibacterales bacterium]